MHSVTLFRKNRLIAPRKHSPSATIRIVSGESGYLRITTPAPAIIYRNRRKTGKNLLWLSKSCVSGAGHTRHRRDENIERAFRCQPSLQKIPGYASLGSALCFDQRPIEEDWRAPKRRVPRGDFHSFFRLWTSIVFSGFGHCRSEWSSWTVTICPDCVGSSSELADEPTQSGQIALLALC